MKVSQKTLPLWDVVYCGSLCLLAGIKSHVLYSQIRLGGFELPLALATAALFGLLAALLFVLCPRRAKIPLTVLYVILSVFMAVDGVYYNYVSRLPSAAQLGMVGQLDDVSGTILGLIQYRHLFQLADLPLWTHLCVNRALITEKLLRTPLAPAVRKASAISPRKGVCSLVALLAASGMMLAVALTPDFETEYMKNEIVQYHVSDFATVMKSKANPRVVDKSAYLAPDDSSSPYYGLAQGRNVIVIQVEALQNFVIGAVYEGQEITPNLNHLIGADTFYFDRYYYQIGGGNTADAEFAVHNSLFAPEREAAYVKYPQNRYHGLPYLLKDNGYSGAYAFHGYIGSFWNRETAYPNQGFDDYTSLEDFEQNDIFGMGLSDKELFRQSAEIFTTYQEPFYAFLITLSSHHPYGIPLAERGITLKPEDEQTLFGLYIQAIHYVDRSLGLFLDTLKEKGLYDNSVFVVYGDHYALNNTEAAQAAPVSALIGRPYTIFDVFNVPMLIHVPGMERAEVIHTVGGHVDVLPTLLCLLGIHNDKTVLFGQNLLEAEEGIVLEQTHVSVGSFISDQVFFQKPHNNIRSNYKAYDRETMALLNPDLFADISAMAQNRIADCAALLEADDVLLD